MNNLGKNVVFWLAIGLMLAVMLNAFQTGKMGGISQSDEIAYSDFMSESKSGRIGDVLIQGQDLTGHYTEGGRTLKATIPMGENVVERLEGTGVRIQAKESDPNQISIFSILLSWFPMLLLIGVWIFFMRQMQGKGGGGAMGFGRSRAKLLTEKHGRVTFDDVAGIDEAKIELQEVVEFLKDPQKFQRLGGKIPKGALLVGPPGTGKTLTARAVAGEAEVPFFTISGSDFVEMFVGVGASRVRDMFDQARKHAPCIIFIDEIDAVGRQRGAGLGGSHDEREQTLNQILVEMDGFDTDETIIMIAATNRPDILDPALLRPGRFDRRVIMDRPDVGGREEIFYVHMRGKPIAKEVDVPVLARATPGFTGADIENVVNEAALLSARRDLNEVSMKELQDAIERVQLGPERRSRIITPEEKELVAYHEAGHALIAWLLPEGPEVRKVTVIPRGMAGGVTWFLADENQLMTTKKFKAQIATALGGRVAEEIIFGVVTTGASGDLQSITQAAKSMVTQYGMSEGLGLRVYGARQEMVFLGREISEQRDYSDAIAEKIDLEVNEIIATEYARVTQLMTDNRDKLELIANTLLEVETLDMKAFADLLEE